MAHGGKRVGSGRKVGSATQRTREIANAIATGLTPLEYLTSIYQDVSADEARRLDAAKAAAPYVHAKLTSIEGMLKADVNVSEVRHKIIDCRSGK